MSTTRRGSGWHLYDYPGAPVPEGVWPPARPSPDPGDPPAGRPGPLAILRRLWRTQGQPRAATARRSSVKSATAAER